MSSRRVLSIASFSIASLSVALLVGCGQSGPPKALVQGNVSVDGKPLDNGVVSFVSANPKLGAVQGVVTKGAYKVLAPVGPATVGVRGTKIVGQVPTYPGKPDSPMRDDVRELKLEPRAQSLKYDVPAAGGSFDLLDLKTVK